MNFFAKAGGMQIVSNWHIDCLLLDRVTQNLTNFFEKDDFDALEKNSSTNAVF